MKLTELVEAAASIGDSSMHVHLPDAAAASATAAAAGPEIRSVVHRTGDVEPGALFCCVRGAQVDGHDLAPKAVAAGAAALVVDHQLDARVSGMPPVPQVVVPDVRRAMGPLAASFWGMPSRQMTVVGVTGTAGKTTITQLLRSVLDTAGRPCGVIGTLSGARTTPEAPELQAQLAAMRDEGRQAVAMEVSSHGLDYHRLDGTWFSLALFTNLSRDHLDYHGTMEAYFAAKARLFTPEFTDTAVICVDDDWGRRLRDEVERHPAITAHPYSADDAVDVELTSAGARFTWQGVPMQVGLTGRFNVTNAVGVATAARALGLPADVVARGLEDAAQVAGRFEQIDAGQPFTVLVDYSHKPDALAQALTAARELTHPQRGSGRLAVVFGCGGDRDAGKRPLMGEVAGRLADRVVVTSDNPRSEDPQSIIDQVTAGLPVGANLLVEPDRRRAMALALADAGPGDVVVVAGRGHEATQLIGTQRVPFDDRAVARELLLEQLSETTSRTTGDEPA